MNKTKLGTSLNNIEITKSEKKLLHDYFEIITIENDFKWPALEHCRERVNFDIIKNYSKSLSAHTIKGHAFYWPEHLPIWTKILSKEEIFETLCNLIKSIFKYISLEGLSNIKYWDISNELLNAPNNHLSLENIFELYKIAKNSNSSIKLCFNEIIDSEKKLELFKEIVLQKKMLNAPIDVYGFQIHTNTQNLEILDLTRRAMDLVKNLDQSVEIHISEVDVSKIKTKDPIDQVEKQSTIYDNILNLAQSHNCQVLTLWGLHDQRSWISNNENAKLLYEPTLINAKGKPKKKFLDYISKLR